MTFVEWYIELKLDGYNDIKIAERLGVCESTLTRLKKVHGVPPMRVRKNYQGLTQEELRIADEKGITRRLALRRVRQYGYTNEDAISVPKGVRHNKGTKDKHDSDLEKSLWQREYYKQRKMKTLRGE